VKDIENVSSRKPYPRKAFQAPSVLRLEWEGREDKEARAIYAQSY
jgi:hypothetical protein